VVAHYIGLTVVDATDLRRKLRERNAEMKVAKKTLMRIAAADAGLPVIDEGQLDGPVGCIFSFRDPLSGAHVAFAFGKTHNQVALIGGVFDGKILSKEEALAFARIPGREPLLAQFAAQLRSPLVSFAALCGSPLGGFARGLKALAEKKGQT